MLAPKMAPKTINNQSKNHSKTKSGQKKLDVSKNSTSPKRDTHFGGSWVSKTLPKSIKNAAETDTKSNQKFDRILNVFFNDFSLILGAFWGRAVARVLGSERLRVVVRGLRSFLPLLTCAATMLRLAFTM